MPEVDLLAVASIRENGPLSVEALERVLGIDGNAVDGNGQPLLHHAVIEGRPDLLRLLIDRGADVNQSAPDGSVALHHVRGEQGHVIARELLVHGADVHRRNNAGQAPLMWLAFRGEIEALDVLIQAGAEVLATDRNGKDAIAAALRGRQGKALAMLLKQAGTVSKDKARAYLQEGLRYQAEVTAVGQGPMDVLLQHAKPLFSEEEWRKEAWALSVRAASRGYTAALTALLEFVPKVNAPDGWGKTLAHYAASSGEMKCVGILARAGADLGARDRDGRTVADYCTSEERRETVQQWVCTQKARNGPARPQRKPV